MLLERELRDIKLKAEQSLISALTRFHKRKLQIQEKKLKANAAFAARKQKHVTRNPLKGTHSANNIVHNDVNIADLQKQISDLKEIVCTHVLNNKKEECYNSLLKMMWSAEIQILNEEMIVAMTERGSVDAPSLRFSFVGGRVRLHVG